MRLPFLFMLLTTCCGCGLFGSDEPEEPKVIVVTGEPVSGPETGAGSTDRHLARMTELVSAQNEARRKLRQTYCSCYSRHYEDEEACLHEVYQDWEPTRCEISSAWCETEEFTAVAECKRSLLEVYEFCIHDCPDFVLDLHVCEDAYEELWTECEAGLTDRYHEGVERCEPVGHLEYCPGSEPASEIQNTEWRGNCDFAEDVVREDQHWQVTFGVSDDWELLESCEFGSWCISHFLDFRPDGTLYHNWLQVRYGDIRGEQDGFCEHGTWQADGCEVRITSCTGVETIATWWLDENGLNLDATWTMHYGKRIKLRQNYTPHDRRGGEAFGLRRQDCGYGYLCN